MSDLSPNPAPEPPPLQPPDWLALVNYFSQESQRLQDQILALSLRQPTSAIQHSLHELKREQRKANAVLDYAREKAILSGQLPQPEAPANQKAFSDRALGLGIMLLLALIVVALFLIQTCQYSGGLVAPSLPPSSWLPGLLAV